MFAFVVFANHRGINHPTLGHFKLPPWWHRMRRWEDLQLSHACNEVVYVISGKKPEERRPAFLGEACPSPSLLPAGQNADPKEETLRRKLCIEKCRVTMEKPRSLMLSCWAGPGMLTCQLHLHNTCEKEQHSYLVKATGIWSVPIPSGTYHN